MVKNRSVPRSAIVTEVRGYTEPLKSCCTDQNLFARVEWITRKTLVTCGVLYLCHQKICISAIPFLAVLTHLKLE